MSLWLHAFRGRHGNPWPTACSSAGYVVAAGACLAAATVAYGTAMLTRLLAPNTLVGNMIGCVCGHDQHPDSGCPCGCSLSEPDTGGMGTRRLIGWTDCAGRALPAIADLLKQELGPNPLRPNVIGMP